MAKLIFIFITIILVGCNYFENERPTIQDSISKQITKSDSVNATIEASLSSQSKTSYLVILDTGVEYSVLYAKMFEANRLLRLPIDTLGRSYNKNKDLIALPVDDEDEIYAGDYFPRRVDSANLSLEYLDFYEEKSSPKNIALVAGIYAKENSADSVLTISKRFYKNAFKIKASIYMGCMH